ncbi:MAG: hypothetical protein Q9170_003548 [Blastenia crenularia]
MSPASPRPSGQYPASFSEEQLNLTMCSSSVPPLVAFASKEQQDSPEYRSTAACSHGQNFTLPISRVATTGVTPDSLGSTKVGFFRLPPEIRHMIYELALVYEDPVDLWPDVRVEHYRLLAPRKCARRHYDHKCRASMQCICDWEWDSEAFNYDYRDSGSDSDWNPDDAKGSYDISETNYDCEVCIGGNALPYDNDPSTCAINYGFENEGPIPVQKVSVFRRMVDDAESIYNYPVLYNPKEAGAHRRQWKPEWRTKYIYVRDQYDLRYLRTNLGAGLLRTCKEIHDEALMYFYGLNQFRFTGKGAWHGLLRFLVTIGPSARSHIKTLDVCAPFLMEWPDYEDRDKVRHHQILDERAKNDPKLRMAKTLPKIGNKTLVIRRVCKLILEEGTLQHLNLVVPTGCFVKFFCNPYINAQHPLRMMIKTEVDLIVEDGACLGMDAPFDTIDFWEWNLVCYAGGCIRDPAAKSYKNARLLADDQVWEHHRYGTYEGIATMFGDEEEFDTLEEVTDHWNVSQQVSIYFWNWKPRR